MKKFFVLTMLVVFALSTVSALAATDQEILFRGIPWGTDYNTAKSMLTDFPMVVPMHGEAFKMYSIDEIILGDGEGIRFEYHDINVFATCTPSSIDVAGYKTSGVTAFFAFLPVDGVLTRDMADTAMYGGRYEFEPINTDAMSEDLCAKLTGLYGEPDETSDRKDFVGNTYDYVYWKGANDSMVALSVRHGTQTNSIYKDKIWISYVNTKGDEMLQTASDTAKSEAIANEADAAGNGNTSGL